MENYDKMHTHTHKMKKNKIKYKDNDLKCIFMVTKGLRYHISFVHMFLLNTNCHKDRLSRYLIIKAHTDKQTDYICYSLSSDQSLLTM